MIKSLFSFVSREGTVLLLLLTSFAPAVFFGAAADAASIRLFLMAEKTEGSLPMFSKMVSDSVAGYQGFPVEIAVASWLLTVILFLVAAFTTDTSQQFRLRFLPGFLLVWSLFLAFVSAILFAWALLLTPLYTRLGTDNAWYVIFMPYVIIGEIALILAIPLWFVFRSTRNRT